MAYVKIGNIKGADGGGILIDTDGTPYVGPNPIALPDIDPEVSSLLADGASMSGAYLNSRLAAITPEDGIIKGDNGKTYGIVAGTARNDGTGWQPHVNTTHATIGVTSMATTSTEITVSYPGRGHAKAVTFLVVPDETLATAGITMGASVANHEALIRFGGTVGYSGYVTNTGGVSTYNIQGGAAVTGVSAEWNSTYGCIVVTHPNLPTADTGGASSLHVTGRGGFRYEVDDTAPWGLNTFGVLPRASDGTRHTAASANHKFFFTHKTSGRLSPEQITTTLYPNSNFWYFGLFELGA